MVTGSAVIVVITSGLSPESGMDGINVVVLATWTLVVISLVVVDVVISPLPK